MKMKRGMQSIALVLLGIVAIIALIGLILLMARMTGASVDPRTFRQPVVESQRLQWENLVGFASNNEDADLCIASGQWGEASSCSVVTHVRVPQHLINQYLAAAGTQGFATACFAETRQASLSNCVRR